MIEGSKLRQLLCTLGRFDAFCGVITIVSLLVYHSWVGGSRERLSFSDTFCDLHCPRYFTKSIPLYRVESDNELEIKEEGEEKEIGGKE